ncbi:hypothetical protein C7I85_27930 [Mesorhizobium soli]|uniref:Uncharacterized protein n=2 Tax=Pseudaminobacter soli (ex Li et al. 2025) TaxID=1295366 RepID=A0A2P7RTV6_9HYPH|nr:hypothetical protein C7I85_27930 [Mesorhizobium soli]
MIGVFGAVLRSVVMRKYLSLHPEQPSSFSSEELDTLDALLQRAIEELQIVDQADRNEAAGRILSLYTLGGRSLDEILEITVRLHQNGITPGGRRSDEPTPKRIRTKRQRRKLVRSLG